MSSRGDIPFFIHVLVNFMVIAALVDCIWQLLQFHRRSTWYMAKKEKYSALSGTKPTFFGPKVCHANHRAMDLIRNNGFGVCVNTLCYGAVTKGPLGRVLHSLWAAF